MRPTLPRRRRLRSPDNVASEEAELTWLDALTEKALARELPTRAEALQSPAEHRRRADGRGGGGLQGPAALLRPPGQAELPGQHQERPVPRGLLLLLAAARLGGGRAQVHLAQARRGDQQRRGGRQGRRQARLPGRQRPRPHRRGCHPGVRRDREVQGAAPRRRGLRLPRPALRRPGRAPAAGRHHRLQPQPQHGRGQLRRHLHHPLVPGPGRHGTEGESKLACPRARA